MLRSTLHRILSLFLLLSLVSTPAWAARGFGATDGTGASDVITATTMTTSDTLTSWSMWLWLTGAGQGIFDRLFDKGGTGTGQRFFYHDGTFGPPAKLSLIVQWSTTVGAWRVNRPSLNAWHHVLITYDSGAAANDPLIYIDGASVTVTQDGSVSGTLVADDGSPYTFGNRLDGIRHLNGRIAEMAIWHGTLLSAGDASSLYNGGLGRRADTLTTPPTFYMKMCGTASPEPNEIVGASTGAVTGALFQSHPFPNCATCRGALMLMGVGGC